MTTQTANLLIEAGLFGLAAALVMLALVLIGIAAWRVYEAVWSPMAKRRQRAAINSRQRKAHYRRMLRLPAR